MKNFLWLTLIGLTFLIPLIISATTNNILITEVQISGDQTDEDYIKICNTTDQKKNLGGFQLKKKSSSGKEYSVRLFPTPTIINEKSCLRWGNSDYFPQSELKSKTSLSKNNSIALLNKEKNVVDAVGWGNGENQYFETDLFLKNPAPYQILKRKKKDGEYVDTNSNKNDFYLTGEFKKTESGDKIKANKELLGEQTPLKNKLLNVILPAIIIALINGIIILKIKL